MEQSGHNLLKEIHGKRKKVLVALTFFALLLFVIDLCTGAVAISPIQLFKCIFNMDGTSEFERNVIFNWRLPIALMGPLTGMALSLSGVQMQTVLDNPLASPFTLGVASAAAFGAALSLVLIPNSSVGVSIAAFSCGLIAVGLLFLIGRLRQRGTETLILSGVALMFLCSAGTTFVQYKAEAHELQAIVFWMFGSINRANWMKLSVVAIVLICSLPFFIKNAWKLTALRLGQERAQGLGLNVQSLRLWSLLISSLLTAVTVSFVGVIGFVGLVAPHIGRRLVGEDQRYLIIASMSVGALLLSGASVIGKGMEASGSFPVGIITSFIGCPFFVYLIYRKEV